MPQMGQNEFLGFRVLTAAQHQRAKTRFMPDVLPQDKTTPHFQFNLISKLRTHLNNFLDSPFLFWYFYGYDYPNIPRILYNKLN